ncbi:MAG: TonB-dependent receptor, partial [Acidobacteriota bacterium]
MRKALKWSALFVAMLGLSAGWLFAQTTGGGMTGKVLDSKGQPVVGAVITVTGPALQGTQGTATNVDGQFTIPYLPVGDNYQIKVSASGYNTVVRKNIDVALGSTVTMTFTLSSGSTQVVVTAAGPIINTKTTTTGATLSSQMIESIPMQRNSTDIAFLAPSAVASGPSTPGNPSIGGSTGAENNYIVNGVDVTNTAYGTNVNQLNFDFIKSMQVMTGGLPPEFGFTTGGVVNAITRSGGNEFHGGAYFYYFSDSMQAKSKVYPYVTNSAFGNNGFKQYDLGAHVGGYIVKDKLWFYAAVDWNKFKEYTSVPTSTGDSFLYLNGAPARSYYAGQSFQDTNRTTWMYATKFTYNVNSNQRLSLSIFGSPEKTDTYANLDTLSPFSAPYTLKQSPYDVALEWNATWTPNFFSDVTLGYHHRNQSYGVASQASNQWAYSYYFSNGVYGGFQAMPQNNTVAATFPDGYASLISDLGSNYMANDAAGGTGHVKKDVSKQLNVKFTNELGHHELSYGAQYQDRDYTYNFGLSGPTNWVDPYSGMTAVGSLFVQWMPASTYFSQFWGINDPGTLANGTGPNGERYVYFAQPYFTQMDRPTNDKDEALWVNDNWSITDYFTLKLGLRYSQQKLKSLLPATANSPIRALSLTGNYAPRVGFTWDIKHNGKSKLYGFAGRYFERVPTDMALRSLAGEVSGFEGFWDPALTEPNSYGNPIPQGPGPNGNPAYPNGLPAYGYTYGYAEYVQGITPNLPVNNKLKSPYTDEYILGYNYQIAPDFKLGARLVYRALGRTIEDLSTDGASTYIITNPGDWTQVPVPSLVHLGQTVFFPKPTRTYKALEITMDKRFSHNWLLQGSWVHSYLRGNYEGAASNDTTVGQLDPNLNATYDLPDFLVNGFGYLPLDRRDVIKAYGAYRFTAIPLVLSANMQIQTGTPVSKQINVAWYGGAVGFVTPRGTAGRTPTTWTLDLGAQYNIPLWKSHLGVRVDIFNVTNNQKATAVYQSYAVQSGVGGPITVEPGAEHWGDAYAHQSPRAVRLA